MWDADVRSQITAVLNPLLTSSGFELVGLTAHQHGKTSIFEVFIDRPQGGITMDECAGINRQLVRFLEESGAIGGDFSVEVSSPGLDWPLRTARDFERNMGRPVRFHLRDMVAGKIEHSGTVERVDGETVIVGAKDGQIIIPLNNINKAVQIIE